MFCKSTKSTQLYPKSNKYKLTVWSYLWLLIGLSMGCGISSPPPRKGPCPIDTLLVEKTFLPQDIFHETGGRSSDDAPARVGVEKIGTTFSSYDKGGLVHHVYRFEKDTEAFQEYQKVSEYSFAKKKNITEWGEPYDLKDLEIDADAYKFACAKILDVEPIAEECKFVAQYGPYETDLTVDMIVLDYNDLSEIINEIDNRMSLCLAKK